MKILINIVGLKPLYYQKGGAIQKLVGYLVKDLKKEHKIIVVGQTAKKIKGIELISQEKKFYDATLFGFILEGIRGFLKICSQSTEIIISTHPSNFFASFLYSKLKKKPLIAWEMDHNFWVGQETMVKKAFRFLVSRADKVITLSQIQKKRIIKSGVKPEKIVVIRGSIDTKKFIPSNLRKKRYIISVGKFIESKNQLTLLQAFQKLIRQKEFANFKLYLIGPKSGAYTDSSTKRSDYYRQCFQYIQRTGLKKQVRFYQDITEKDLIRLYQQAALFVFPSQEEALGLSLLEAMACGCPCVANNIEPLSEILADAGKLVDAVNTNVLAEEIEKLLTNQQLANRLARLARKRAVSQFNTKVINKKFKKVLETIR